MASQILVALSPSHRMEEVIPYIQEIATAGMRVVFLIRVPADLWSWLRDHWVTTESSKEAMLAGSKIIERYSWERQRALAEERVAPWRHVLQNMGVEVSVDAFTGSLASMIDSYGRGGEFSLIMRTATGLAIFRFLHQAIAFVGLLRRTTLRPVLLLRPSETAGKVSKASVQGT
jgi:hypothetical protein